MGGDGGSAAERVEPVAMSKRKQMEELEYRRRLGLAMERKQGQWKLKWKRLAGLGMEELKLLLLARDEDKTDMSKVGLVAMG